MAAFALWMGGFTFYSSFAIPAATELLEGGHRAAGFITQRVTLSLNLCGVVALVLVLWNIFVGWRTASRTERGWLAGTWVFLVAGEIALIVLHPMLDAKVDVATRHVLPGANFDTWHRAYLWVSTAQWISALPLLWFTLAVWRREDRGAARG